MVLEVTCPSESKMASDGGPEAGVFGGNVDHEYHHRARLQKNHRFKHGFDIPSLDVTWPHVATQAIQICSAPAARWVALGQQHDLGHLPGLQ